MGYNGYISLRADRGANALQGPTIAPFLEWPETTMEVAHSEVRMIRMLFRLEF